MTVPPLARAVARALADEPLDLPPANEERRERTILAIRTELALRETRRARRRWAMIALVAAAVLLSSGGVWTIVSSRPSANVAANPPGSATDSRSALGIVAEEVHGEVFLTTGRGTAPLGLHAIVGNEQDVVTRDGDVTLALGNAGTRVRIDARSSAALTNGPEAGVVRVRSGAVTATVAKLHPHERFLVQTDEAEVEAHGTVFTVARTTTAECGARTFVHVVEGRISVRDKGGTLFLGPTEDWKSICTEGAAAPTPSAPPTPTPRPVQTGASTTSGPSINPTTNETNAAGGAPLLSAAPAVAPSVTPYPEFGRRK